MPIAKATQNKPNLNKEIITQRRNTNSKEWKQRIKSLNLFSIDQKYMFFILSVIPSWT